MLFCEFLNTLGSLPPYVGVGFIFINHYFKVRIPISTLTIIGSNGSDFESLIANPDKYLSIERDSAFVSFVQNCFDCCSTHSISSFTSGL